MKIERLLMYRVGEKQFDTFSSNWHKREGNQARERGQERGAREGATEGAGEKAGEGRRDTSEGKQKYIYIHEIIK